jgi:UDP-glucose:(heptosyl)LPS alpha-1,3-glucosyltransferase
MRIAIIKSNYMPFGGGEKYAHYLVNAFAARGHTTDVLTAEKEEWVGGAGIHKIHIPMSPVNNFLRLYTFNKGVVSYMRKHLDEYSCVLDMDRTVLQTHIRAGGGSHRGWLERRRKVSSLIKNVSFSLNPFHNYMLHIEKQSLKNPYLKKLICISRIVQSDFLKYYDIDPEKTVVIHNGVEWDSFAGPFRESMEQKDAIRRELNFKQDMHYFLYVGSGYERKGVNFIINALTLLPRYCYLVVIGKDRNERRFKIMAHEKGVADRVLFLGPRQKRDVVRYLQGADSFILPSVFEPFGSAAIEALAMGLFTITSASTGCSEIIKEGCGTVVKTPWEIEDLAEGMRLALQSHDRTRIRESVREFSFDKKLQEIIDLCLDVKAPDGSSSAGSR